MASTSEDSEDEALPNPAQWLAMLGDENEEGMSKKLIKIRLL